MNSCIPHHKVVMVLHTSRVKYPLRVSACYTAVRIKNCSKSTSVIAFRHYEKHDGVHALGIVWNESIHCPSLSAIFNSLHSSTNQELFEKDLCNQDSHYEKRAIFVTQRKPSHAITQSTLFTVSKDKWEDTGKSLKNALDILRYVKRHLSGWSDVEQWKKSSP